MLDMMLRFKRGGPDALPVLLFSADAARAATVVVVVVAVTAALVTASPAAFLMVTARTVVLLVLCNHPAGASKLYTIVLCT